jgi:peptide/nickel transport system ATP-binding protein
MTIPILEVEDLRVGYPVHRGLIDWLRRTPRQVARAVDGLSLQVRSGEMLALVGESGCGKTSTVQAILGMVAIESGSIRVRGTSITGLSARRMRPIRRRLQMIYQDPYESLDPRFTVRQTLEEPLLVHRIGGSRQARESLIRDALERAELSPAELYLDRFPHELSGGQRQRVAIAASLVLEPELLLADEPVSMLDVSVRAGVLSLLDRLRRNGRMGIVMITHDLSTAAHFADRIAVMYLGRIIEEGPSQDVIHNPQHPYTRALLSIVPRPDPRQRVSGQILTGEAPNPLAIPAGCRFHPRCPAAEESCRTLDDPVLLPVPNLRGSESVVGHRAACPVTVA